ncbi:MAG: DMT family transporter [Pseudomonadota bacterium]
MASHRNVLGSQYAGGVVLLLVSAVAFSTTGVFAKGVEAGAWAVILWRGVFAATSTTLWAASRGGLSSEFFGMGWAGLAVGIVGAIGTAALIPAFKLTTVANVALIYAAAPFLAAIMAWMTLGERVSKLTALGAGVALVGVGIIVSGSIGQLNLTGDALALSMTLAMSIIMVIYRAYPRTPSAGPSVLQSVFLFPMAIALGEPFSIAPEEMAILAGFGVFHAIASVTLAEGAKRVPAGQTALIGALETPLAPIFALLILSEVASQTTLFGGAIVLAAVLISLLQKPAK